MFDAFHRLYRLLAINRDIAHWFRRDQIKIINILNELAVILDAMSLTQPSYEALVVFHQHWPVHVHGLSLFREWCAVRTAAPHLYSLILSIPLLDLYHIQILNKINEDTDFGVKSNFRSNSQCFDLTFGCQRQLVG